MSATVRTEGRPPEPDPGLCGSCRHARRQRSARGGSFLRCRLAEEDDRYLRYPPLPVRACTGHAARGKLAPGGGAQPGGDR